MDFNHFVGKTDIMATTNMPTTIRKIRLAIIIGIIPGLRSAVIAAITFRLEEVINITLIHGCVVKNSIITKYVAGPKFSSFSLDHATNGKESKGGNKTENKYEKEFLFWLDVVFNHIVASPCNSPVFCSELTLILICH